VGARPVAIYGTILGGGGNGGRGNGRGGAQEASRLLEVSRVATLQPLVGGGLGCLTQGGRGMMRPSGPGVLGRPISEKNRKEK
jgi:hypothetical protein